MANTRANWATPLAVTWTQPEIGLTFIADNPVFATLMMDNVESAGYFNQNWSSGSTAAYVGADLTASGVVAGVVDTNNIIKMGAILGPEETSTIVQGNGFTAEQEAMNARSLALAGIATKFTAGFIASDTGKSAGTIQGMSGIITSYGLGAGQQIGGGANNTTILGNIDSAFSAAHTPGRKYILTTPAGGAGIKAAMRIAGYGPVTNLTLENFIDTPVLVYDGAVVLESDQVASSGNDNDYYCYRVGPGAMQLVTPPGGPFNIGSDVTVLGDTIVGRNITLQAQVWYQSPRCCAKIIAQGVQGA